MVTWSSKLLKGSRFQAIRTRIALRKSLHREPTLAEVESALARTHQVTSEDIVQAYNRGEEVC